MHRIKNYELLGRGTKGKKIYLAERNGQRVVIKIINKNLGEDHFLRLVQGIPGIVKLLGTKRIDNDKVAMIMECCEMDLYDFLEQRVQLDEILAKNLFEQAVKIVIAITNRGIIHGDIKIENFLIDTKTFDLKLCDFELAYLIRDGPYFQKSGTHVYLPPEWHEFGVLFNPSASVWALGVLLYSLVHNDIPFHTAAETKKVKLIFSDTISPALRSLIKTCLAVAPSARPSLIEILKHPWMR